MTLRALCAAALLAAPIAASAYARTEACAGAHLWWRGAPASVPLEVNVSGFFAPECTSAAMLDAVRAAALAWSPSQPHCTDFRFDVAAVPTTSTDVGYVRGGANQNLVVFRTGRCSDPNVVPANDPCASGAGGRTCADAYGCWDDELYGNAIAVTTVSYVPGTGEILDADVEFRGWDGSAAATPLSIGGVPGEYFTCAATGPTCASYGEPGCRARDVQAMLTHEAGHALGLAHSAAPAATMYPTTGMGELTKRDLDPDDVAGVCAIYPAGVAAAADGTCGSSSAPPPSGGGCSQAGSGFAAGALLAVLLAAGRRRRRAPEP